MYDLRSLVGALASYFGIPLSSEDELQRIADEWSLSRVQERLAHSLDSCSYDRGECSFSKYDPTTHLHGNHISNNGAVGGWMHCFEDVTRDVVESHVGPLIRALRY